MVMYKEIIRRNYINDSNSLDELSYAYPPLSRLNSKKKKDSDIVVCQYSICPLLSAKT